MPLRDVALMLRVAKTIDARERLAAILDTQVGSGVAKLGLARRHVRQLRRASEGRGRSASLSELAAFGIKVEHRD